jgi:hypothetical protein
MPRRGGISPLGSSDSDWSVEWSPYASTIRLTCWSARQYVVSRAALRSLIFQLPSRDWRKACRSERPLPAVWLRIVTSRTSSANVRSS